MEGNSSITPKDFITSSNDPDVMDFIEFEDYIADCVEKDFFAIMPDIFPTINYLINKGMNEDAIYTWIGNVNDDLRGRNALWKKAFVAAKADYEIQKILDSEKS